MTHEEVIKVLENCSIIRLKNYKNCELVKACISAGIGEPEQIDNMCEGYTNGEGNEPFPNCQNCNLLYCNLLMEESEGE